MSLNRTIGEGNGTPLQYSCLENPMDGGAWWAAVHGVAKSRTRLSDFPFTFHFHPLQKEMATHSSVLAWRIPGTAEPGGLPSVGSHRVGHDWSDLAAAAAAATGLWAQVDQVRVPSGSRWEFQRFKEKQVTPMRQGNQESQPKGRRNQKLRSVKKQKFSQLWWIWTNLVIYSCLILQRLGTALGRQDGLECQSNSSSFSHTFLLEMLLSLGLITCLN